LPTPGSPIRTGRGARGEIDGVFLKRPALLFGVRVVHFFSTAHFFDRLFQSAADHARIFENARKRTIFERREHEQLARYVLIAPLLGKLVGDVKQAVEVVRDMNVAGGARDFRERIEIARQLGAKLVDIATGLGEQRTNGAALLIDQCEQHVRGLDDLMVPAERQRLRIGERRLELAREFVLPHDRMPLKSNSPEWEWPRFWGRRPSVQGLRKRQSRAGLRRSWVIAPECAARAVSARCFPRGRSPPPRFRSARPVQRWPAHQRGDAGRE
jgi:hypothetical protein